MGCLTANQSSVVPSRKIKMFKITNNKTVDTFAKQNCWNYKLKDQYCNTIYVQENLQENMKMSTMFSNINMTVFHINLYMTFLWEHAGMIC